MARKKAPAPQELPLEQQPLFLDTLAALPTEPEALEQVAAAARELYNDALRSNALQQLELATVRYKAAIYRLNGDTWFGCRAAGGAEDRLQAAAAAPLGAVPGWGQVGQWLLEIAGMRLRVCVNPWSLGIHSLDLYAVDAQEPFLSATGYRSHLLHPDQWLGHELGQVVRVEVERLLQGECPPVAISDKDRPKVKVPAWLAPVLSGVTRNGQLAMPLHGEALPAPEPKAPMSNSERQKAFRARARARKAKLKAEGLHTLELSSTDLGRLFIALDVHVSFSRLLDWDEQGYRELATRLFKGEKHGAAMVQALGTSEGVAVLQKQRDKDAKRGWESYHEERKRSSGLVNRCNTQAQELAKAQAEVKRLQAALQEIAVEVGAAPVREAVPAPSSPGVVGRLDALQIEVEGLRKSNAMEVADRARAFDAVAVLQARLKKAGLPHDYRAQPGE